MLSDFFRINLPYGLERDDEGQWMAFNREYKPLGYNKTDAEVPCLPVYTRYKGLTERLIMDLTDNDERSVNRDEQGKIWRFWLYNDSTNPVNQRNRENMYWNVYWRKLKKLARLNVKYDIRERGWR